MGVLRWDEVCNYMHTLADGEYINTLRLLFPAPIRVMLWSLISRYIKYESFIKRGNKGFRKVIYRYVSILWF